MIFVWPYVKGPLLGKDTLVASSVLSVSGVGVTEGSTTGGGRDYNLAAGTATE